MHSPIAPHDGPGEGQSSSSSALSSSVAPARNGSALSTRKAANLPLQRSPRATNNDAPRKPTNLLFTKRHKQIGWVDRAAVFVVDNQIRLSLFILFTLGILYLVSPALRPSIDKFYLVSYHSPATGRHGKGTDDAYFVFFWIVVFTFLRAAAFDYVFIPLARVGGVRSPKALVRFSEQAWLLAYYSIIWPLGMYLMYRSPYWFNVGNLWTDWPLRELDSQFKWYYLVQFAFWLQQIFVLNIEPRRKDFHQMFAHHIITSSLIAASYAYHMTRVGNVILCMMDVGDILLAVVVIIPVAMFTDYAQIAKNLKYLGYHVLCDYAFGVFLMSWVIGRHIFYIRVVVSAWKDSVRHIPFGCYTSNSSDPIPIIDGMSDYWTIAQTFSYSTDLVCFTKTIQMSFLALLVALQIITLCWFYMILAVAWRVVQGGVAEDTRSDDEDEDTGEQEPNSNGATSKLMAISEPADKTRVNGKVELSCLAATLNAQSRRHSSSQPFGSDGG